MWVLKLWLTDKSGIFEWRAKQFKVTLHAHKLSYYEKKNFAFLTGIMLMEGLEENKRKFIKDLRKDKRISKLEVKKDFFNFLVKEKLSKIIKRYEAPFYVPSIIFIKPVIEFAEGGELWEIASWNKKDLDEVIKIATKLYKGKVLMFREKKLDKDDIQTFAFVPKLTEKQKRAFELAKKHGYYEYPRKINLKKLSVMMGISYSTFQFHLRNAEKKILVSL